MSCGKSDVDSILSERTPCAPVGIGIYEKYGRSTVGRVAFAHSVRSYSGTRLAGRVSGATAPPEMMKAIA